jgi:putative DNA-invertase from lambdoid prophage Rac
MKVFGYCRASSAEQANSSPLLEAQRRQINHYATIKGWPVAEFFMEIGVSGSIPFDHRPEGQRLLATLQPGDVVVTAGLDHAFRAAADILDALEQLKKNKIAFHVVDLGGDVTDNAVQKVVLERRAINERDYIPAPPPTAGYRFQGPKAEEGSITTPSEALLVLASQRRGRKIGRRRET